MTFGAMAASTTVSLRQPAEKPGDGRACVKTRRMGSFGGPLPLGEVEKAEPATI